MNERIKELAIEARKYADENVEHHWHPVPSWDSLFEEKFAELIAEECARICDSLQNIPATEPRHCAEDIRLEYVWE